MATNARKVRGSAQKTLVKSFESLCGRHGRWEVWDDWIRMCAIAISNAVDRAHREKREKTYGILSKKYTAAETQTISEMLALLVQEMEENPNQDFLGELFMVLGLGNEYAGQFFTPYNVCEAMSELSGEKIAADVARKGWISVSDPACGAGCMLLAFVQACKKRGTVNYQRQVLFTGQDIDRVVAQMCYIQLSLLGCPGYVVVGDTLARPTCSSVLRPVVHADNEIWFTPMWFSDIWAVRIAADRFQELIGGIGETAQ